MNTTEMVYYIILKPKLNPSMYELSAGESEDVVAIVTEISIAKDYCNKHNNCRYEVHHVDFDGSQTMEYRNGNLF